MMCWLFGHADAIRDVVNDTKVWRCSRCWATWPRVLTDPLPAPVPHRVVVETAAERVRARLAREAEQTPLPWRRSA